MGRDDELFEYAEDDEGKAIKWRTDRNQQDGRTTDHAASARKLLARRKSQNATANAMQPSTQMQKKGLRGMASLQKRWVKKSTTSTMDEGKRRALDKFLEHYPHLKGHRAEHFLDVVRRINQHLKKIGVDAKTSKKIAHYAALSAVDAHSVQCLEGFHHFLVESGDTLTPMDIYEAHDYFTVTSDKHREQIGRVQQALKTVLDDE